MLIDTCTLVNFAVVDALWVLERRYGGQAGWTESVRHEIRRGIRAEPTLQRVLDLEHSWLGNPVRLTNRAMRSPSTSYVEAWVGPRRSQ